MIIWKSIMGLVKRDIRSLDYSSYSPLVMMLVIQSFIPY